MPIFYNFYPVKCGSNLNKPTYLVQIQHTSSTKNHLPFECHNIFYPRYISVHHHYTPQEQVSQVRQWILQWGYCLTNPHKIHALRNIVPYNHFLLCNLTVRDISDRMQQVILAYALFLGSRASLQSCEIKLCASKSCEFEVHKYGHFKSTIFKLLIESYDASWIN